MIMTCNSAVASDAFSIFEHQILNFARTFSLSVAPNQSCSTLQNCELFCGNSTSSQELVIVGIKLGTVWSLFYLYWTSKLINLVKIPIIYVLIFQL